VKSNACAKSSSEKDASQELDSIELHDFPVKYLGMKFGDFGIRGGRCVVAARDAICVSVSVEG
jgi:hypothetical protein